MLKEDTRVFRDLYLEIPDIDLLETKHKLLLLLSYDSDGRKVLTDVQISRLTGFRRSNVSRILTDGQKRLTAFWRVKHNKEPDDYVRMYLRSMPKEIKGAPEYKDFWKMRKKVVHKTTITEKKFSCNDCGATFLSFKSKLDAVCVTCRGIHVYEM